MIYGNWIHFFYIVGIAFKGRNADLLDFFSTIFFSIPEWWKIIRTAWRPSFKTKTHHGKRLQSPHTIRNQWRTPFSHHCHRLVRKTRTSLILHKVIVVALAEAVLVVVIISFRQWACHASSATVMQTKTHTSPLQTSKIFHFRKMAPKFTTSIWKSKHLANFRKSKRARFHLYFQ